MRWDTADPEFRWRVILACALEKKSLVLKVVKPASMKPVLNRARIISANRGFYLRRFSIIGFATALIFSTRRVDPHSKLFDGRE